MRRRGAPIPTAGIAPHVVGWVAPVPAEQLGAYRARGYRGDEWVGVSGLEAWGEEILAGLHGGALNVVTGAGEVVATVAERPAVPSRAIYTTIDRDFQEQVQQILGGRKGAIVVLDAHTGAVLALASGPGFDSNAFVGPAGAVDRSQILADSRNPLFNRATQGTYPSASVFKIVTTAAALEEAEMHPDHTIFYCPGYWEGLGPASRKGCWKEDGHGDISFKDGLTASCDVTFYAVGQTLDGVGQDVLPRFGRGFGFGEKTGLEGVLEEGGLMPDPDWKVNTIGEQWWVGDTVNIAIGQGYLLVTPLQVARMIAAVANGGTLYRPYIIERIGPAGDAIPEQVTQPEVVGTLPISAEHLAAIQEALLGVTTKSIGTAPHRFAGLSIPVAGKTGTAEVGGPDTIPHSWFAAYAPANNPEIAIVVLAENAGEGSSVAAPLTRQVVEAYYGLPLSPLPPWRRRITSRRRSLRSLENPNGFPDPLGLGEHAPHLAHPHAPRQQCRAADERQADQSRFIYSLNVIGGGMGRLVCSSFCIVTPSCSRSHTQQRHKYHEYACRANETMLHVPSPPLCKDFQGPDGGFRAAALPLPLS